MTRRVITYFQRALIPNRYKTTALERVWSERQRGEPWCGGEKRIMTSTLPPHALLSARYRLRDNATGAARGASGVRPWFSRSVALRP